MSNRFCILNLFKKAFTLSESLIVIAILGVVATLTIVTLSGNSHKRHIVTTVSSNYSILNRAYDLAVINKDNPTNWQLGKGLSQRDMSIRLANYFKPYLFVGEDCTTQNIEYTRNNCYREISDDSEFVYLVLANGYILGFSAIDPDCNDDTFFTDAKVCGEIDLLLDTNSKLYGRNVFQFFVTTKGVLPFGLQGANQTFKAGCNINTSTPYSKPFYDMSTCTAWVIYRENMDYLECPEKLDWNASSECKN